MKNAPVWLATASLALLLVFAFLIPKENHYDRKARVGASDDFSGFVLDYMKKSGKYKVSDYIEPYFIRDCWTSTAQWALRSDVYDMAILCAEAAKEFVEISEGKFEIVSAVMQNSDLFVIAREPVEKVSMVQNKHYQADLIRFRFGEDINLVPLMVGAVPFALVRGDVDAGIMDYTKAVKATDAGRLEKTSTGTDYDSFVLVANKEFMKTTLYKDFVKQYNEASVELTKDRKILRSQMLDYAEIDIDEKGWEDWTIKIKTLKVSDTE